MRRGAPIPEEVDATIKAELAKVPHASRIARESTKARGATLRSGASPPWAGIEFTAGRRTVGRPLPPEQRAKVERAVRAHPEATQQELGRQCGVSRSTVGRVVRARRAVP
jgi:hypothetical protein